MKVPALVAVALAVSATALPGWAADAPAPVVTYAHCGKAAKVTVGQQGVPTYLLDGVKPTTSFAAGGGCGSLDSDKVDADGIVLKGTHTGLLDRLTVDAHVIDAGPVRAGAYEEIYANAVLTVDGEEHVLGELHLVPKPSASGLSRLLQFSVTGIGLTDPETDAGVHEISISLETASYLDGDQVAWVLDATEVPTGVVYSPSTLAPVRVDVSPVDESLEG